MLLVILMLYTLYIKVSLKIAIERNCLFVKFFLNNGYIYIKKNTIIILLLNLLEILKVYSHMCSVFVYSIPSPKFKIRLIVL